jgi:putative intracellular protease/amidase
MANELQGERTAVVTANDGVEQVELTELVEALREAGAEVELLAPEADEIQAFNHLDRADIFPVDREVFRGRDARRAGAKDRGRAPQLTSSPEGPPARPGPQTAADHGDWSGFLRHSPTLGGEPATLLPR